MRLAMIAPVIALAAALCACGDQGGEASGPERRGAAGEVLGGEVSDAMIPLDTVRSTSPAAPRPVVPATGASATTGEQSEVVPDAAASEAPEPAPADPAVELPPAPPPG